MTFCLRPSSPAPSRSRASVLAAIAALALGAGAAIAQPCNFTGCCGVLASNATPLPGQTTTIIVRGGVNPTGPCWWYGIGRMSGTITGSASTNGIPAAAITAKQNIGFFGAISGASSVGTTLTNPLRIQNWNCQRNLNLGGPGSIFGGCPINNSAQDMYRFNFTVPAGALPGTQYTFNHAGNVHGILTWSYIGAGCWVPNIGSAIPTNCGVTITVGGTVGNNSCGNCTPLSNGVAVSGTTVTATTDGASGCGGTNDVWYCFTPQCPQPITVSTCGSVATTDTVLSVHTACPGVVANQVACNDDAFPGSACPGTLASSVTFNPTPGQTYYFRVATLGAAGPFVITMNQAPAPPPANDNCATAQPIANGTTPFSTCGATAIGPAACANIQHDIWYRYIATCSGTVSVSSCGSQFNTALAVYSGPCTSPCQVVCNDDNGIQCAGTSASASFQAAAGGVYLIRVGGSGLGQFGAGQLTIGCTPGGPSNDLCANLIPASIGTTSGTTLGAAPTPGLAGMCGASNAAPDVFYSFSTCNVGPVTITTCGAPPCSTVFDTVVSVHNACPSNTNNQLVVCNDDAPAGPCAGTLQSFVTFTPVPCRPYVIRVSGFAGLSGNFNLNISQASAPPPNNACANAISVSSGTSTPFTTCGSTTDGPLNQPCGGMANDMWYNWVPQCTGQAVVDTCGSNFDSVLAVYASAACIPPAATLVPGGCNDDSGSNACGWLSSRVTINVIAGQPYKIRVGGYFGQTGCGTLTITGPGPTAGTCPPILGSGSPPASYGPTQYFQVLGTSTGQSWKWRLEQACCFKLENCNVPGVPAGGSQAALAAAFVASVNAQFTACSPAGPRAIVTDFGGGLFGIKSTFCPNLPLINYPIRLSVGDTSDPCNALCYVGPGNLYTTGPCNFNPWILEIEATANADCNNNGIDDAVDIAADLSADANGDGVPDECGGVCDSIDFNNDEASFDPTDIDAFLSVFSEGPCIPIGNFCNDIDFNNDGALFDPCDIESFLLVFSEGPCTPCGV